MPRESDECEECGEPLGSPKTCTFCYPEWEKRKSNSMRGEETTTETFIIDGINSFTYEMTRDSDGNITSMRWVGME